MFRMLLDEHQSLLLEVRCIAFRIYNTPFYGFFLGVRIVTNVEPVTVGQSIMLECVSRENRPITWTLNGMRMEEGGRVIIKDAASIPVSSLLTIERAHIQDGGEYTCSTTPEDTDSVTVTVLSNGSNGKNRKIYKS